MYNRDSDDQFDQPGDFRPESGSREAHNWAVGLHLSQFLHFVLPGLGIVAPILIWQLKKADYPELDAHGKNVINWMISLFLYGVAGGVLGLFLIGTPFLLIIFLLVIFLAICPLIFPIIGAVKASNGVAWKYPGTITFFK